MRINLAGTVTFLLSLVVLLSSCSAIEGIFKAGVWVGILFVAGIIALIVFIISKMGGK